MDADSNSILILCRSIYLYFSMHVAEKAIPPQLMLRSAKLPPPPPHIPVFQIMCTIYIGKVYYIHISYIYIYIYNIYMCVCVCVCVTTLKMLFFMNFALAAG